VRKANKEIMTEWDIGVLSRFGPTGGIKTHVLHLFIAIHYEFTVQIRLRSRDLEGELEGAERK
jgi:hypothetical protein